jgi:Fe-S-cluster containining protein
MARIRKRKPVGSRRKHYPHEKKYPWLSILLDSYAIHDYEMAKSVAESERRRRAKIVCHKGCYVCCLRADIPISFLEVRGILWYVTEVMDYETQEKLKPRLLNYRSSTECPFLLDGLCSVYPVRPLACRGFFVFGAPCEENEDPAITRPEDIHRPDQALGKRIAMRFLDYDEYGLTTRKEKEEAFEGGIMYDTAKPMHGFDWSLLIDQIDVFGNLNDD